MCKIPEPYVSHHIYLLDLQLTDLYLHLTHVLPSGSAGTENSEMRQEEEEELDSPKGDKLYYMQEKI